MSEMVLVTAPEHAKGAGVFAGAGGMRIEPAPAAEEALAAAVQSREARAVIIGVERYTGVLYRNPNPPTTYGQGVTERQEALKKQAVPRHEILNRFKPAK